MHFLYVNQAFYVPWCEKFYRSLWRFWIPKKHPQKHTQVITCSQKWPRSWSTWSLWSCGAVSKMLAWLEVLKVDGIRRLHAYPTVSCRSWPVVTVDQFVWPFLQPKISSGNGFLLGIFRITIGLSHGCRHCHCTLMFWMVYVLVACKYIMIYTLYIFMNMHIYIYFFFHFHQTHLWLIDCVVAAHVIIDVYPYISLHHSFTLFITSFPPSFFHPFSH